MLTTANCNDCICSEVCYYKSFNDVRNLEKRRNDVEKICKSFVHRDRLKNATTVDAPEVVHGHWEEWLPGMSVILTGEEMLYMCSNCTAKYEDVEGMRYCPYCGAKMDEV